MDLNKMFSILILFIIFTSAWTARKVRVKKVKQQKRTPEEIKQILLEHEIIPDVIDNSSLPAALQVTYLKSGAVVNFGNNITRLQAREPPTFLAWPTKLHAIYALIMIDPDYPDRKKHKLREWQNWLVVNITGCNVVRGQVLTEYVGVEAKKDTGVHRYVFLVYEQPQELVFDELEVISIPIDSLRAPFKTREFVKKYNMKGPVAVNFFLSEFGPLWPDKETNFANMEKLLSKRKPKGFDF